MILKSEYFNKKYSFFWWEKYKNKIKKYKFGNNIKKQILLKMKKYKKWQKVFTKNKGLCIISIQT